MQYKVYQWNRKFPGQGDLFLAHTKKKKKKKKHYLKKKNVYRLSLLLEVKQENKTKWKHAIYLSNV